MFKSIGDNTVLTFYGQFDDKSFAKFVFHNIDGKAKLYSSTFDNYRKISSVIEGVGDTETALSTRGANNYLHTKADLVNGLVPAAQLPSYVDDVVDFNGFTPNIVDVAEEDAILNYPANTRWVCTATVEPFKSKYNQKILYVNANTSKEDWTIIEPEKDKIYINIGVDEAAISGDTFRWSGTVWVNLNQNLKERLTTVEKRLIVLNLGTVADVNDLSSIDQSILNDLNTLFTSNIYTFSQATFIFKSVSGIRSRLNIQSIKYQDKEISFILPNGQVDTYKLEGTASTNYTFTKISSTGIVVTLDESELNKTYTDESFKAKLESAAKLIVKFSNAGIKEFHRGSVSGSMINYINTNSTSGAQVISFNVTNGKLSEMSYSSFAPNALFYGGYSSAGGTLTKTELNKWMADMTNRTLFISRSDINVELSANENGSIKSSSIIVILDPDGTKSPVPCFRTSTENNNYIWYGWLNASTVERLSYDDSTRKFAITNMQIGKDSLDSRIMNLPYSQLGTTVSNVAAQEIERASAIVLTTTGTKDPYNKVMFTRASTSATEIKFVNTTITGSSYSKKVEYITFNPETNALSSISV